ncbi:MAG: single-stranded-DNA-specific exonuclease RecJ [Planctomycetota bacterium]|nr:single-stranded-DNA-specific exonuclease RecJ [Planctomycetota bacterium]
MSSTAVAPQFRWKLQPSDPGTRDRLAQGLELRPLIAQLLLNRGVEDLEEADRLLKASLAELPDPTTVPGFADALDTLLKAQEAKHKVLIHGDYDVDGTCGSVLLHHLMNRLGLESEVFIPDRVRDGYSFSENSLAAIEACGAKLVIAVDNGTTAITPLKKLAESGVAVIVVDHHLPGEELPECAALMNPWLPGEDGKPVIFPEFCGAAVAWLLTWGVLRHILGSDKLSDKDRRFLFDGLGYAAIATICDVMPLRGPNRGLVHHGLATLRESSFPGLRAIVKSAGIRDTPTATDVGFRIGPRLNAAGRLFQAEVAFRSLATTSAPEADRLCAQLEALNLERRNIQQREVEQLHGSVEEQFQRGDAVIFSGHSDAHFGVLGIVANQVMERTGLPSLLWAECTPGVARGSARSPEGFHLVKILDHAAEYLLGYGGHARAAGFHFKPEHADQVAAALQAGAAMLPKPQPASLTIDSEIGPAEIDRATVHAIEQLEPFGQGFDEPMFLCSGARLAVAPKFIGDGSHVELRLERDGQVVRALGWRMADRARELNVGDRVDVVVNVGLNHFRGRSSVEWTIRDFQTVP